MIRYLAIDHGTKRIGLAIGDDQGRIASPLTTIDAHGAAGDVDAILRVADEYGVDEFVIGLPLNMDDSEGPQAKAVRSFGDQLATRANKPVHYFDERLSSFAADELMRSGEFTRKKKREKQDRVAAQVLLQGFLDSRP